MMVLILNKAVGATIMLLLCVSACAVAIWAAAVVFQVLSWALGGDEIASLVMVITVVWLFFFYYYSGRTS